MVRNFFYQPNEGNLMIQLMNMVAPAALNNHGDWSQGGVREFLRNCSCDGIEMIYDGSEDSCSNQKDIIFGYHLMFYADWIDFWRKDTAALNRKFGSDVTWRDFYLGSEREALIRQFQEDLLRAASLNVKYVVFHVSDVSVEEGFTYRWEHTDEEVIDAAAEFINLLLDGQSDTFEFLVENLHWPGFTFTRPEMTERLLSQINYKKKGIMLDTGHLMCTNLEIKDQADGCRYIHRMMDEHGALCKYIRGVHLHQSVTGAYVKQSLKNQPVLKENFYERFAQCYEHIGKIDTHQPFDNAEVYRLIERIAPEYLVHEIAAKTPEEKKNLIKLQQRALKCLR